ncbi:hypothetical protein ACH5RR_015242 [Cinchona calisaya]|uniref:Uncharacterized protein n=1 Tax=Cinchona calisaya TaxID=153742 RepID=A0ABD2ZXW5_9GENT
MFLVMINTPSGSGGLRGFVEEGLVGLGGFGVMYRLAEVKGERLVEKGGCRCYYANSVDFDCLVMDAIIVEESTSAVSDGRVTCAASLSNCSYESGGVFLELFMLDKEIEIS